MSRSKAISAKSARCIKSTFHLPFSVTTVLVDVVGKIVVVVVVGIVVVVVDKVVVAVAVVVVAVVVDVVEGCISSSPERHCVTISPSLTIPSPVLTSHPPQSDLGHPTYLSCSFTKRPLYGHLGLAVTCHDTQILAGKGDRLNL